MAVDDLQSGARIGRKKGLQMSLSEKANKVPMAMRIPLLAGTTLIALSAFAAAAGGATRDATDLPFASATPTFARQTTMNEERLAALIGRLGTNVEKTGPVWTFEFKARKILVLTDAAHDRMRVMTLVASRAVLGPQDMEVLLHANFDRALDARYALFDGKLWSLFLHPLAALDDAQFAACLSQVHHLAENFGTTYTSSDSTFGGDK